MPTNFFFAFWLNVQREATLCSSGFLLFRTSERLEVADRVTVDEVSLNISTGGTIEEVILL